MQEPEKMELTSMNITAAQREKLRQLFPEVFTEGDKIDFDRLKLTLGEMVDTGKERYGLVWPGKADCFRVIQAPSRATLRPCPEESINFDTTGNLIIEGDNLEVLKLLQKSYLGKVKMIYIDPPYNTGSDFIYADNYIDSLTNYLSYTGQVDREGVKFTTNTENDGRFHSKWLNMMYPRLFLGRNLLSEQGVIFISIDDHEIENLKKLCNDIFGEENYIASLVWEKGRKNDAKLFSVGHEYIIIYAKSLQILKDSRTIWREEMPGAVEVWQEYLRLRAIHGSANEDIERDLKLWYKQLPDKHPSKKLSRYCRVDEYGPWRDRDISWPGGGGPRYDVIHPITGKPCKVPERGWGFASQEEMQRQIHLGLVVFREDHTEPPFRKAHIRPVFEELDTEADLGSEEDSNDFENVATRVRGSYFYKQAQVAVKYLRDLMGGKIFDNPKDHEELARLIKYVTVAAEEAIILDFFAGSGATAEAVMSANEQDGGNRKYILVQIPEPTKKLKDDGTWKETPASRAGYNTVADICKERVRRVIAKLNKEDAGKLPLGGVGQQDRGFRVYKLDTSSFKAWNAEQPANEEQLMRQLELHIDHIVPGRTEEDILAELLLKAGLCLTDKVEKLSLAGKTVYNVAEGSLLVCLEYSLTREVIEAMADLKPQRIICLDAGFAGNDQLKTNAALTFKSKGVMKFQTV